MLRKILRLPRWRTRRSFCDSDGFAAVDALVALLILSATLVFCLDGLRTADRLSRVAEETSQATRLASAVLPSPTTDDQAGRTHTLSWTVAEQAAEGADKVCARVFTARSLRDSRIYRVSTAGPCSR